MDDEILREDIVQNGCLKELIELLLQREPRNRISVATAELGFRQLHRRVGTRTT
jgi:hypothetical protein